jgi:hypothetical protein
MSISLTHAAVDATRSLPELYAPAGGRPPSLTTEGEDLATLDQRPQVTTASPPAPRALPPTPSAGSATAVAAAVGSDTMTPLSLSTVQPSAAAGWGGSGRDVQLGVNFDTLA